MNLTKKGLGIVLSTVKDFNEPSPELEQYITPPDIAAELLWTAYMDGNIKEKVVIDMGCGTGILSFGASMLGAKKVLGYDIDEKAISIAKENLEIISNSNVSLGKISFEKKDVLEINKKCNTVVMNPPFGVQKRKADKKFLEKAFELSKYIYSIHKIESRKFLEKVSSENNFKAEFLGFRTLKLKPSMDFHEKRKHPVEVGLWKFTTNE